MNLLFLSAVAAVVGVGLGLFLLGLAVAASIVVEVIRPAPKKMIK